MTGQPLACGSRPALRRGVRRSTDPLTGEPVLLFPEGVLVMNGTAASVVACCDGAHTVDGIVASVSQQFTDVRAEEVLALLDDLVRQRLLQRDG